MTPILKWLIGLACFCVILAASSVAYFDFKERQQLKAARESAIEAAERRKDAQNLKECRQVVSAWDAGNEEPARQRYASAASDGVGFCRTLIEIDRVERKEANQ